MSKRNPILYIIVSIIVIASPFALNESFKYFQGLASMKFEPIYKLVNIIVSAVAFGILMPFHVLLASRLDKKARFIIAAFFVINIISAYVGFITMTLTNYVSQVFVVSMTFAGIIELIALFAKKKDEA